MELLFDGGVLAVGVAAEVVNEEFLPEKLTREGLAEGQDGGFSFHGLTPACSCEFHLCPRVSAEEKDAFDYL